MLDHKCQCHRCCKRKHFSFVFIKRLYVWFNHDFTFRQDTEMMKGTETGLKQPCQLGCNVIGTVFSSSRSRSIIDGYNTFWTVRETLRKLYNRGQKRYWNGLSTIIGENIYTPSSEWLQFFERVDHLLVHDRLDHEGRRKRRPYS